MVGFAKVTHATMHATCWQQISPLRCASSYNRKQSLSLTSFGPFFLLLASTDIPGQSSASKLGPISGITAVELVSLDAAMQRLGVCACVCVCLGVWVCVCV